MTKEAIYSEDERRFLQLIHTTPTEEMLTRFAAAGLSGDEVNSFLQIVE